MGSAPPESALQVMDVDEVQFFQESTELLALADVGGGLLRINARWEEMLGYSAEELAGAPFFDLVHPSERDKAYRGVVELTDGACVRYSRELRIRRSDGNYLWFDWSCRLGSNSSALHFSARDITELKRATERYQVLVESAPNGLMTVDPDGTIVLVNHEVQKLFGYTREELIGSSVDRLVPTVVQGHHASHRGAFTLQSARRRMGANRALRGLRKDGTEFPLEVGLNPMTTPEGTYVHCAIVDVSERQQRNAELTSRVRELQRHHEDTTLLSQMTSLLQHAVEEREAVRIVGSFLERLLREDPFCIYLLPPAGSCLELALHRGAFDAQERFPVRDCWAVRRMQKHTSQHNGPANCAHLPAIVEPDRNVECFPLSAHGQLLGLQSVLTVQAAKVNGGLERVLALSSAVADQLGMALGNLQLRNKLQSLTVEDALTGVYNRRHLDRILPEEFNRAVRRGESLSVFMLDIDHFKRFNDEQGHQAADQQLKSLATTLKSKVRDNDVVCRFGGEEFVLVLPGMDSARALQRAEEIRQAVFEGSGRAVTVSVGVATYPDVASGSAELLGIADKALYFAKEAGRNRVASFRDLAEVKSN